MYKYLLMHKSNIGNNVLLLTLHPKNSYDVFQFYPGQYATIGFIKNGRPSPLRCFSIVSSPAQSEIKFAIRVGGKFTTAISNVDLGSTINIQGPFGNFIVDYTYEKSLVLMAGGIGITPFISIIQDIYDKNLDIPVTLLYSVSSRSKIPFHKQLLYLENQNPNLRIEYYITNTRSDFSDKYNHYFSGRIDANSVKKYINNAADQKYFICGPKPFKNSLEAELLDSGVNPNSIIIEEFAQASKANIKGMKRALSLPKLVYLFTSFVIIAGFVGVMAIDLLRTVPKLAAQELKSSSSNMYYVGDGNEANDNDTQESTIPRSSDSGSMSAKSDSSSSNDSLSGQYTNSSSRTYHRPVSSVS
jgi:ferredoxin-NADP reductase